MKLETLVKRYKNLGYEPKNLERDLEINEICKWLWETHNIHVEPLFMHLNFNNGSYLKFAPRFRVNCDTDYSTTHGDDDGDKYFTNPFDAKFEAVKYAYRWAKN